MKPRNPHASALRHFKPKLVKDKRQDEKRKTAESEARIETSITEERNTT